MEYSWKRFYCPRDGSYKTDDRGFLLDPEADYARYYGQSVSDVRTVLQQHCVVFLGEPGIGKSHEINTARQTEKQAIASTDDKLLFIDLRSIGSQQVLYRKLFDHPSFLEWIQGTHQLYLYLDSLDEGLLRIDVLSSFLQEEFKQLPTERLFLRIACRTAEWPETLGCMLKDLFGNSFGIFELTILRYKDVESAAQDESIDCDTFIQHVIEHDIVAFAAKPVTLKLLLNIYKREGALPTTRSEIYEKGCLLLCEEIDDNRRMRDSITYSSEVLLTVASRMAAITVFCNKYAINMKLDYGDIPPEDIPIHALVGGSENSEGQDISVDETLIRKALNTGLFNARGPYRMGWAHMTYAEFLSARYLKHIGMTTNQILSLLVHPAENTNKIIPQLHETSSWIANYNTQIMSFLLKHDPEVLLRCDLSNTDLSLKKELVSTVLKLAEEVQINEDIISDCYHKLKHIDLASQLLPYLVNKHKHFLSRRIAIDIAEACKVQQTLPELLTIIFDPHEAYSTRSNAAYAVTRIGNKEAKLALKHYITNRDDDPEDELKGCALRCLFPELLSTEELFANLTAPRQEDHIGSYHMFLCDLVKHLSIRGIDYIHALNWLARDNWREYHLRPVKNVIMEQSWGLLLEYPALIEPFAAALYEIIKHCEHVSEDKESNLNENIIAERDKAQIVTKAILPYFYQDRHHIHLIIVLVPLVVEDDLPWLIEQCSAANDQEAISWAELVSFFCRSYSKQYYNLVIKAKESNPILSDTLAFLNPVEIDAPQGRKMKAGYLKHLRFERRMQQRNNRPLLQPSPIERVCSLLEAFENDNKQSWWQLNLEMTLEPNSSYYGNEITSDLRDLPVWKSACPELRARLIKAAKAYINNPPDLDNHWIQESTFNRPYAAGYRAILLLYNEEPDYIRCIAKSVWETWAPIFVKYPLSSAEHEEPHLSVMKTAYHNASTAILIALSRHIDAENERSEILYLPHRILDCFDAEMGALLFEKTYTGRMKEKFHYALCDTLLNKGYVPAIERITKITKGNVPDSRDEYRLYIFLAASLVHYYPQIANSFVWSKFEQNEQFARDLILQLSSERDFRHGNVSSFVNEMHEDEVAKLYIWIEQRYPSKDDPQHNGTYSPSDRDNIAEFRNGLLTNLRNRGTFIACKALEMISERFPNADYIKWIIVDAENNARRKTWIPLSPRMLLQMACDRQKTYIDSGVQLLICIVETLDELHDILHGEKSQIESIWDNRGSAKDLKYCPKEENRFSDYVAWYLEDRLKNKHAIVNREVEIRKGQETDIHVVAVNPNTQDQIKVIIEVKGCWHKELKTAMQSQLVETYLKNNQCPYGIYLVGWFLCDKWHDDDYRKAETPPLTFEQANAFFENQANTIMTQSNVSGLELKSYVLDARM